ncbi:hypothetical protein CC1G_15161 [Coprinopsis cinerea okayama7|uniref:Uncharacterized protein n=1 Tax=Coprinopsis cinerea (strain Okayama-7 / 130 / ATCC MYA-4618 / FGSC 9003) TaxID=240176 RepID=D6RPS8_COPC7|nr:hypothetical protein CC1G_15161 [Coprinopsis cinerea okayama7\|eukprot:XP_002910522.1 hypothetical protein CC1G_15161 [Coprinopsis cinerea okayama7\
MCRSGMDVAEMWRCGMRRDDGECGDVRSHAGSCETVRGVWIKAGGFLKTSKELKSAIAALQEELSQVDEDIAKALARLVELRLLIAQL